MEDIEKKGRGKVRVIIFNFIRILLVLAFLGALYTNRTLVILISVVGLIVTFIPYIMRKVFNIKILAEYEIISILFIYGALFLGEVRGLFAGFWWWDVLLNFAAAVALGLVGFTVLYTLYKDKKIRANPFVIAVLTFCFALAIGTLWEIFEFSMDILYGFTLQGNSLRDTMGDLITNAVGAFVVSIFGYSYIKNGKVKIISEYVVGLIEKHPKLFSQKSTLEPSYKEIQDLIKRGENSFLEFKSTLRTNLHTNDYDSRIEYSMLKTITAFLNSDGGTLLVGVSDSGKIQGLEKDKFKDNDSLSLHFINLLKNHIGNEYLPFIDFELFPVKDKHILKIDCLKSIKPVFLKIHNDEEFYVRKGPSSIKLTSRELIDYIRHKFTRE